MRSRGYGESDHFDASGDLWKAELTPRQAIEMIQVLIRGVPKLRQRGGFKVTVRRKTGMENIPAFTRLWIEADGSKRIVAVEEMVLTRSCLNEHVIIHELAHVASDTVHGKLGDPQSGHGLAFRTWCSILEEYWLEIKRRKA